METRFKNSSSREGESDQGDPASVSATLHHPSQSNHVSVSHRSIGGDQILTETTSLGKVP